MITEEKYLELKEKYERKDITNDETSEIEVYEFMTNPPDKYFLYINEQKSEATTWTGQMLGRVYWGNPYKGSFGDIRIPIDVYGINGKKYHGTYYKSAGDYARIKQYKKQAA